MRSFIAWTLCARGGTVSITVSVVLLEDAELLDEVLVEVLSGSSSRKESFRNEASSSGNEPSSSRNEVSEDAPSEDVELEVEDEDEVVDFSVVVDSFVVVVDSSVEGSTSEGVEDSVVAVVVVVGSSVAVVVVDSVVVVVVVEGYPISNPSTFTCEESSLKDKTKNCSRPSTTTNAMQ